MNFYSPFSGVPYQVVEDQKWYIDYDKMGNMLRRQYKRFDFYFGGEKIASSLSLEKEAVRQALRNYEKNCKSA